MAVVLAAGVARLVEVRMTDLILGQVMARADDEVELGLLPRVTAADFDPPFSPARLDDLSARLDAVLQRVREQRSGVIRVNLFALDGTVMYSDLASLRGTTISPLSDELLGEALAGSGGAEVTSLAGAENRDLAARYGSALEAYVPCVLDGRVVGVYEFYTDAASIQPIRPIVWTSTGLGFGLLLLGIFGLERTRGRPRRNAALAASAMVGPSATASATSSGAASAPLALAMGAVPLSGPPDAPGSSALMLGGQMATECWLTRREMEILRLLATGRTYREIGHDLVLSAETVRSHVKHILRKLEVPDRAHAVAAAERAGILRGQAAPGHAIAP